MFSSAYTGRISSYQDLRSKQRAEAEESDFFGESVPRRAIRLGRWLHDDWKSHDAALTRIGRVDDQIQLCDMHGISRANKPLYDKVPSFFVPAVMPERLPYMTMVRGVM